jgi:malonate decarboxylase delta subunit
METLEFSLASQPLPGAHPPAIRGVVGSGNLEVLIVAMPNDAGCHVTVNTSARGFRDIWQAVLEAFAMRHPVGQLDVTINDMGATPAVVTLRLEQALAAFAEGSP